MVFKDFSLWRACAPRDLGPSWAGPGRLRSTTAGAPFVGRMWVGCLAWKSIAMGIASSEGPEAPPKAARSAAPTDRPIIAERRRRDRRRFQGAYKSTSQQEHGHPLHGEDKLGSTATTRRVKEFSKSKSVLPNMSARFFLCRKKASPSHLGPSGPIFCVGRKNLKKM